MSWVNVDRRWWFFRLIDGMFGGLVVSKIIFSQRVSSWINIEFVACVFLMLLYWFVFVKVENPIFWHVQATPESEDMQPIELRLDTLSCFQLAIFGLDLLRSLVWDPFVVFIVIYIYVYIYIPSRILTYPTKREKENHRLKSALLRDMLVPRRVYISFPCFLL